MQRIIVLIMTCSIAATGLSGCSSSGSAAGQSPVTGGSGSGGGDGGGDPGDGGDGGGDSGGNGGGDPGDGDGGGDDGDGGGEPPFVTNFAVVTDAAVSTQHNLDAAEVARLLPLFQTATFVPFADLPADPALQYGGFLSIGIIGTVPVAITSPTVLSVDVANQSITGTASEFLGYANDEQLVSKLMHYQGAVSITSQSFSPVNGDAVLALNIDSGAAGLSNGVHTLNVQGVLVGGILDAGTGLLHAVGSSSAGVGGSMASTMAGQFIISQNATLDAERIVP